MDVGGWLRRLGLEQYEAAFRENEISGKVLPNLTAEDLKDLGVAMVGHRRMLLDAIAALRAETNAATPVFDVSPAIHGSRAFSGNAASAKPIGHWTGTGKGRPGSVMAPQRHRPRRARSRCGPRP